MPKRARLLILSSPHNPTGKLIQDDDWKRLARFADRGGIVLVDEVYRDLQRRPPPVAAARHDRFLTTGGLTKTYGLGGLRLGWVLGAPKLLDKVRRVDNLVSVECSTPSILALRRVWPRLNEFRRNAMKPVRANLTTLRRSGLDFIEPDAGLTAFIKVGDGTAACEAMEEQGVGFAAGRFFGAPRFVRAFLGADPKKFARGIACLVDYLEGR
jgi:aspartate/methionine/tyrosine aminotransferase